MRQEIDMTKITIVAVTVPSGLANLITAGKRVVQLPLTASR